MMRRKSPRVPVKASDCTQDNNRINGTVNEHRIYQILLGGEIDTWKTKASGSTYGDQDLEAKAGGRSYRISCKHKVESEKGKFPSLPFAEVCEPLAYTARCGKGEVPVTIVTWEDRTTPNPKRSDFAVIPLSTLIELLADSNQLIAMRDEALIAEEKRSHS